MDVDNLMRKINVAYTFSTYQSILQVTLDKINSRNKLGVETVDLAY